MTRYQAILVRFCKGFIASSIPVIVTSLSGVQQFNSLSEVKVFLISIAVPILTGAFLALEKALNWVEPEKPVEIKEIVGTTKSQKKSTKKSR